MAAALIFFLFMQKYFYIFSVELVDSLKLYFKPV